MDLPRFPMPMDVLPRERALRGQKLLRANLIGPGDGPAVQDPEAVAIMFDTVARQADARAVPPMLRGRLRPRGSLRVLLGLPRVFG